MENKNVVVSDISVEGNLEHMKRVIERYEILRDALHNIEYKDDKVSGISEFAHDLRQNAYDLLKGADNFATSDDLTEITITINSLQQLLFNNMVAIKQQIMMFLGKRFADIPDIISDYINESYGWDIKYIDETIESIQQNVYQNDLSFIRRFCSNCKFLEDNIKASLYTELCKGTDEIYLKYVNSLRAKIRDLKCIDEKNIVKN